MARFFSYSEIIGQALTPVEDLQWIAGQIAQLPPFVHGSAVLCGSICWGKYSWRSDIDIAHFSTIEDPHIERLVADVIQSYVERTQGRFIAPRFDVIAIGAESMALAAHNRSVSAPALSVGALAKKERVSNLFEETAVVFADHLGSLGDMNGDPWRAFLNRYLSAIDRNHAGRREAIKRYVGAMTTEWARQPLHPLTLGPNESFTAEHLDLIGKSENYPINLMRRILGDFGAYPRPDRAPDVLQAFAMLEQPWSKSLLVHFQPFFSISEQYERIVAACKASETPLAETDYYKQLRSLFIGLPFADIQQSIWEYLRT